MTQFVAFLRAVNVGGRTVKMDRVRQACEALGLTRVETFMASGNVVFESRSKNTSALEQRIEQALAGTLGIRVAVFVRTGPEVADIAGSQPFGRTEAAAAQALNVAFVAAPLDAGSRRALFALRTSIDAFHVDRREIYWLCQKKQSESTFSNAALERAIGQPATLRGISTLQKLAAKYALTV